MASPSAASSASSGINSPGGSISKNSPGVIVFAIIAAVVLFWIVKRKHK